MTALRVATASHILDVVYSIASLLAVLRVATASHILDVVTFIAVVVTMACISCGRVSRSNGDTDLGRSHDSLAKCLRESFGDSIPRRGCFGPKFRGLVKTHAFWSPNPGDPLLASPRDFGPKNRGLLSEAP